MDMSFIRRLLDFFDNAEKREIDGFPVYNMPYDQDNDNIEERIVTMHSTADGKMVMSLFNMEQWDMVCSIAEISEKPVDVVVAELAKDNDITTIVLDPGDEIF
jgi:hypothetical protein